MTDNADIAALWAEPWTAIAAEFLMRIHAVMDLGVGLHDLARMAQREVAARDSLPPEVIAADSNAAQGLSEEARVSWDNQLAGMVAALNNKMVSRLDEMDEPNVEDVGDPFQWVAQFPVPDQVDLDLVTKAMGDMATTDIAALRYISQYGQALIRGPRLPVIQRALLITAVASVESTVAGIIRRLLYNAGGQDQWGSWDEPSLDETVRKVMGGGIEGWQERFQADMNLDLVAATCDWDALREVFARRNLFVHNGGVVDQKYIARVANAPTSGTRLDVNDDYLRSAIDLLCGWLVGVISAAWVQAAPDWQRFVARLVCSYTQMAESELRWPLAENLHKLAARFEDEKTEVAVHLVNGWLARIHRCGPMSVDADVRSWPTEDLPRRFEPAKLILLRCYDDALTLLPELLGTEELSKDNLGKWPLFAPLRERPDFQELMSR